MFDRRLITNFNWPLLGVVLLLTLLGLINLYSATSSFGAADQMSFFKAQIIWSMLGFATLVLTTTLHYRHFNSFSYFIYGLSILLLLLVLFLGQKISGHQSWLALGPFRLQPSEFAKLAFILALSRHLALWEKPGKAGLKELLPSFLLFILPTGLVMLQGDLGSSLFFGLIYFSMILVQGVKVRVLTGLFFFGLVIIFVGYFFFLSPYQKSRIHTFVNPESDRRGAGYHLIQSKIAVGSGAWSGKGFLKGQAHKLKFIPERHTDFIFPVLAEEWGFLGCSLVLGAFLIFFLIGLEIGYRSADRYSFFLSMGICALFFWHVIINLGGVLGLMPLTGVPLPFFSYGGSALLTNWIGIGLLLNISMRRYMFF